MSDPEEFRIGLIGAGATAQVVHLPILTHLPGVRVVAVCDVDRDKAATVATRFGIPKIYRSDDEILAAGELDGVVICTPNRLHEANAIAALEAGKHVLVEKPLALDADGARRVLERAERAESVLMVALNNRHRPDCAALKPFARGGELGELFLVKAGSLSQKVRTLRPTWRHRRRTAGGGALMDLGVQMLDLCLWTLDYPKVRRVVASMHPGEGMEVEDFAAVMLELEDGPVVSIEATWSLLAPRDRQYLELLGTRGSASLSPFSVYKEMENRLLDVTPMLRPGRANLYTTSYAQQLQQFIEAGRGERSPELPYDQIELMRLIALAYRSAEEGREIEA